MAAGAADVAEHGLDELAGVARVAEIAHAHDELPGDDARDDRPLDVLDLQQEVRRIRDEVLARRLAEEGRQHLRTHPARRERARDVLEPLHRDFRALHLPDERRIGQRVEERERLEVHAVGLAREEQRIGLDRVEHRRRRALGDADVHRAQVLRQDGARRSIVGADVLEHGGIARLLGMVIDETTMRPALGNGGGGISGPAIHPIAVRAVHDVREALPDVPIVGVGGVASGWDAAALMIAGANAVQVGTANFYDPGASMKIVDGLADYCLRNGLENISALVGTVALET